MQWGLQGSLCPPYTLFFVLLYKLFKSVDVRISMYIYKPTCLYEHVSWIALLCFGLEIAIMSSQIAYYICPVSSFPSRFVTACSVLTAFEHAPLSRAFGLLHAEIH